MGEAVQTSELFGGPSAEPTREPLDGGGLHRRPPERWHGAGWRRRRFAALAVVWALVVVAAGAGFSLVSFVATPNGDTAAQRAVTWAREHGFGGVIDVIERRVFAEPPSTRPADELALVAPSSGTLLTAAPTTLAPTTAAPTTLAPTTAAPTAITASTAAAAPSTTVAPTAPPTTVPPMPQAPTALAPVVTPPLAGEGEWVPVAAAGGQPAVWATSWRPSTAYPSVIGSFAVIDQTRLVGALFNGSDVPGGKDWRLGNRVPEDLHPMVVAAFNGGFRFEHIKGGYVAEGREVRPLVEGEATLAVGRDGRVTIGAYGRDLTNDGTWVAMRQNLPLLVDGGQATVRDSKGVWWGADFGNEMYVLRSSVCLLGDGRLMYGAVGKVDAIMLSDVLASMGCVRAMQLDINGTWPTFFTFGPNDAGQVTGTLLDRRMGGDRNRYLRGSTREFVAFFDRAALAPGNVVQAV